MLSDVRLSAVSEPAAPELASEPASEPVSEPTAETAATETEIATDANFDVDRGRAFEVALNKRRVTPIPSLPDLSRARDGPTDYDTDLEVMSCHSEIQGSGEHGSPRHSHRRNTCSLID